MSTNKERTKKIFRRLGLGLLGLVILLVILAHSSIVQINLINRWLAQQSSAMGISARVQNVDVNLFSRSVKITGFEVYDHRQNLLFDIESLQTSIRSFSSTHLSLGTTHISNIIFRLRRYQEDSVSNLQRIIDLLQNPSRDPNAPVFAVRSSSVFLKNGDLSYVDEVYSLCDTFQFIDFKNVALTQVNLSVRNLDIAGDHVLANIDNLSFKERRGFDVSKFGTRLNLSSTGIIARETRVVTPFCDIDLDLRFTTQSWEDYQDFVSKVRVYGKFRESYLNLKDLVHFAPKLQGKHNRFYFSGTVWGLVNNFQTKDFDISYGQSTRFDGDIYISGLPDFNNTFFDLSINNLTSSPEDIRHFLLPNAQKITLPNELNKLGVTSLSGSLLGFPSDLRASLNVTSDVGNMQLRNLRFSHDTAAETFDFSGHIDHSRLALGRLLNDQSFGNNLRLSGYFDGNFSSKNGIDLSANMVCENVEYQNRQIDVVSIKGDWIDQHISAFISIEDNDGSAEFSGDLSIDPKNLFLDVTGFFDNVNLLGLQIWNDTNQPLVSSNFSAKIYSFNIDSLVGTMKLSDLQLVVNDSIFRLKNFLISQDILQQDISTTIHCDFFNANILGNYRLSNLGAIWDDIQNNYLSALNQSISEVEALAVRRLPRPQRETGRLHHPPTPQALNLTLNVFKTDGLLSYFLPKIHLPNGAHLKFGYDSKEREHLSLNLSAKNASVFGVFASNLDLEGHTKDNAFEVNLDAKKLYFRNARYFENLSVVSSLKNNCIIWQLDWNGVSNQNTTPLNGNLDGRLDVLSKHQVSLNIQNSELLFIDQLWQFEPSNTITVDSLGVHLQNIRFFNQNDPNEYLTLNGDLTRNPNSRLDLAFNRYQLRTWSPLIKRIGLDFDGVISGEVNLFDVYNSLHFNSNLRIDDFSINNFFYGTAFLQTSANERTSASSINFEIRDHSLNKTYLSAEGNFFPNRPEQNFDIRISVSELDLSFLKDYVSDFSSSLTGKVRGNLTLDGPLKKPNLYGNLIPHNAVMRIDYLNTFYAITCERILFSLDSIIFVSTNLVDTLHKTQSTLTGGLYHNRFNDFRFNLNAQMDNFFVLNTTLAMNDVFFGQAFFTGNFHLGGSAGNVLIDARGRTERGTEIRINHVSNANFSENNQFIHFVVPQKDTTIDIVTPVIEASSGNLIVRLNIDVTPDATFFFDMNIPPTVGMINASGSGNLRLNFESRNRLFTMFGDYVLQDGFYDFSFEDRSLGRLISRRFYIERGGTLQWTGDPANMILNVSAVYSTRASLFPILSVNSGNVASRQKVNVQSAIHIDGRMSQPNINFDFRLPNIDEQTRTEFFSILNRDDGNEMTLQTFNLLLLGNFTTPHSGPLATNVTGANVAWDVLSGQINNILQNFSNNINIGFSHKPEDIYTTGQTQVSVSTELFDNRVLIDGSWSGGGLEQNPVEPVVGQQNTFEVNAEWRITNRFSFRVFNRPNNDRAFSPAPQTENFTGFGIAWRRDFNSFRPLSRKRDD